MDQSRYLQSISLSVCISIYLFVYLSFFLFKRRRRTFSLACLGLLHIRWKWLSSFSSLLESNKERERWKERDLQSIPSPLLSLSSHTWDSSNSPLSPLLSLFLSLSPLSFLSFFLSFSFSLSSSPSYLFLLLSLHLFLSFCFLLVSSFSSSSSSVSLSVCLCVCVCRDCIFMSIHRCQRSWVVSNWKWRAGSSVTLKSSSCWVKMGQAKAPSSGKHRETETETKRETDIYICIYTPHRSSSSLSSYNYCS